MTIAFSLLALGALTLPMNQLAKSMELSHRTRLFSSAQMVKLFIDLRYEGEWYSSGGRLFKGLFEFVDYLAIRNALSDYLSPDTLIYFHAGEPGSSRVDEFEASNLFGWARRDAHRDGSRRPEAPPDAIKPPHRPDLPFLTRDGAGIVVRSAGEIVIGWISIESGQDREALRSNRAMLSFLALMAAIFIAATLVFGFVMLRLTRPIDRMAADHEVEKAKNAELADRSRTDHLTGLLNRRGFEESLGEAEGGRSSCEEGSHVALLDIDHFKAINDARGHDEGDRTLARVAETIAANVRSRDLCCRWGGEEFVLLFMGTNAEQAAATAERIRAAIESRPFGSEASPLSVTATIGLAPVGPGGFPAAVASADAAMYRGKREGRNRVVLA